MCGGDLAASAGGAERLERLPSGVMRLAGPVVQRLYAPGQSIAIVRCGPIYVFVHDAPDATGGLLQGDPKEVPSIDPRWVGPHHWDARIEVEVDRN